jgi:hypothetical protein
MHSEEKPTEYPEPKDEGSIDLPAKILKNK